MTYKLNLSPAVLRIGDDNAPNRHIKNSFALASERFDRPHLTKWLKKSLPSDISFF